MTIKRLRWSREPDEQGLQRVCQRPRGRVLRWGGHEVALVRPDGDGYRIIMYDTEELGVKRLVSRVYMEPLDEVKKKAERHVAKCRGSVVH